MGWFNHQHPILISDFHSLIPYHPFIALVHPDLAKLGWTPDGHGKVTLEAGRKAVEYLETLRGQRQEQANAYAMDDARVMTLWPLSLLNDEAKAPNNGGGWPPIKWKKRFLEVANVVTHHSMDLNLCFK